MRVISSCDGRFDVSCLKSTGKYAVELGYHVALVSNATAATSPEAMQCAHEINGPTYARARPDQRSPRD